MSTATATATTNGSKTNTQEDSARLRLYTLIGEGYQAMLDGRESTLEDVKQRIEDRRNKRD